MLTYFIPDSEIKAGFLSFPEVNDDRIIFFAAQRERAPTTGALHFQAYLEAKHPLSLTAWRDIIPGKCEWQPRKGTREQAIAYCSKDESRDTTSIIDGDLIDAGPWLWKAAGYEEPKQGKRSDLEAMCEKLKSGASDREIAACMPEVLLKYPKGFDRLREALLPEIPNWRTIKVTVLYGQPGTGKSRTARDIDPDLWSLWHPEALWFDGYDRQKTLLIDEFIGKIPLTYLNQILDGYRLQIPKKGSSGWAAWTNVIICSNMHPMNWYTKEPKILQDALLRRLTEVREIKEYKPIERAEEKEEKKSPPPSPPSQHTRKIPQPREDLVSICTCEAFEGGLKCKDCIDAYDSAHSITDAELDELLG